jgi:hypothetical protein
MPKIYLSPYMSRTLDDGGRGGCGKSFEPLHAAIQNSDWPYDYGDDPSFFCRRKLKGALTWGVCRADVRDQVHPDDAVVFFSFTKVEGGTHYRLGAIVTVERKIRHSDIFVNPSYKKYSHYLNLLVRPNNGNTQNWEHHEPGSPEADWHEDWLSRIVPFKFYSKAELQAQARMHRVSENSYIDGKQFRFGCNYVIFSQDPALTFVVDKPPTVAHANSPNAEVWHNDPVSRGVFGRTVKKSQPQGVNRGLRLDNKVQQPHSPPIRWVISEPDLRAWRQEMFEFLLSHGMQRF